ncbi:M48 family metallopeptidase [Mesobacillus subterraneus]|uniref:M48 family metallopeptidase n=1 Tax=Mesobacillus subterraneus TaxID=285983 RepID=UPI0020417EA5|nr:M48 family metallopeptidase [Mesobacillus subterraneus]MCM3574545.1 M48 family metallopeptidase [Mesobacillus subterraneus]
MHNEYVCPDCSSAIPFNKGYVSWCDCGYNMDHSPSEKTGSKLNALYEKLGNKRGQKVFQELVSQQELRQRISFSKSLAFMAATIVHLISISLFLLGLYLLIFQNDHFMFIAAGLILIGIAWLARPRVPKLDKDEHLISRQEFPFLFKAVDQLADAMHVKRIDGIIIDDEFNASVAQVGWRRRKIIKIGLPLFSIMEPEEQLAILAHEFGHISNGDLTRSFYIGTALYTLQTWYELLNPVPIDEYDSMGFFEIPVYYFMAFLALIPYSIFLLLVHLLFDDSQKGEYLADERAAKAVGYKYLISSMEKFQYADTFYLKIRELAVRKNTMNLFHAVHEQIKIMPDREKERLSRLAQHETSKLDSTHPPTAYRIKLLENLKAAPSALAVGKGTLAMMQKELETQQTRIQEEIIENYRYVLNMY